MATLVTVRLREPVVLVLTRVRKVRGRLPTLPAYHRCLELQHDDDGLPVVRAGSADGAACVGVRSGRKWQMPNPRRLSIQL